MKEQNLAQDTNAGHKLLRSNDLELGAEGYLLCEVSRVRGEKSVRGRLQRGDEHRDIRLVANHMAMPIDLLLGWKRNELRLE
jgi:hypothetical protein